MTDLAERPEPAGWQRVLIVGGPGSGKSTLGMILARSIACPYYDLDTVGYESGAGAERPLVDRLRDVSVITGEERWVAEGSYIDWTSALADAADGVVCLDPPWRVARYRIVTRHIKASLRRSNRHPGLRKLWRFVGDCRGYYVGEHARRLQVLAWIEDRYAAKTIICTTNHDVERLIDDVRSRTSAERT